MKGPTERIQKYLACDGCEFHRHSMIKSGGNPVYSHYCNSEEAKKKYSPVFNLEVWIGHSSHTPSWCPFLQEKN